MPTAIVVFKHIHLQRSKTIHHGGGRHQLAAIQATSPRRAGRVPGGLALAA